MNNRRRFLKRAGIAALGFSAMPVVLRADLNSIRRSSRPATLPGLNYRTFAGLKNTAFWVSSGAGIPQAISLAGAAENLSQPGLENFSLRFVGRAESSLPQDTYRFYHPRLGNFSMFIVPKPESGGGVGYEAIFNRLV